MKLYSPFSIHYSKKHRPRYVLLFAAVVLVTILPLIYLSTRRPAPAEAAWYSDSWIYRQRITISNSSGSDQTDFQVQLTLDTATPIAAGKMQSDCDDLRFTSQGGNLLSHWLEPGTCDNASTLVWVKIPTIPNGGGQIYVYYGNPGTGSVSSTTNTFIEVISGVIGAWDMDDNVSGDAQTITDSSGSSIDVTSHYGANTTGMNCTGAGQFGYACDFDGTDDYLSATDPSIYEFQPSNSYSLASWVNFSDDAENKTIIGQRNASSAAGWVQILTPSELPGGILASSGTEKIWQYSNAAPSTGAWHQYVVTYDGSQDASGMKTYIDGTEVASYTTNDNDVGSSITFGTTDLRFAANYDQSAYFDGQIDNARIYNKTLSATSIANLYGSTKGSRQGYVTTNYPGYELIRKYNASVAMDAADSEEIGPGPVAYWKFDEGVDNTCSGGSNDICDSTSNGNDGTFAGNPEWLTEDMCVSGKCLFLDGTDDRITIANDPTIDFGDEDFTLSFWYKASDSIVVHDSDQLIIKGTVSGGCGGGVRYSVYHDASTWRTTIDDNDTKSEVLISPDTEANIIDDHWHHITFTRNTGSNLLSAYVDGNLIDTATDSTGSITNSCDLEIGYNPDNNEFTAMFIDELKIYPYARTADQIKSDYAARGTSAGSAAVMGAEDTAYLNNGLVGYWKMDEASGTSVADTSGNSNTGTLTNAQETGTSDGSGNSTTVLVDGVDGTLSSTDDVYNGMILYINDDGTCALSSDEQRLITDYTGATQTVTVGTAFSATLDSCPYEIRHQVGGKFGNSLLFDDTPTSGDYVTAGSDSIIDNIFDGGGTVSAWIYPEGNNGRVIDKNRWVLYAENESGGYMQFSLWYGFTASAAGKWTTTTRVLPINTWNLITLVYNSDSPNNDAQLFLNGELMAITEIDAPTGTRDDDNSYDLYFGNTLAENQTFDGKIDEARLYNRTLSPAEVADLYNWAPGPIGYWPMDEKVSGDSQTIFDKSGNAHNATTSDGANNTGMDCTTPGKYGAGCDFDSNDDYITVSSFTPPTSMTYETWYYARSVGETLGRLFNHSKAMAYISSSYIYFEAEWTTPGEWRIAQPSLNAWHHIAIVYNFSSTSNEASIYIDGVNQSVTNSTEPSGSISLSADILYLGNNSDQTRTWDGVLDETKIYNYARTPGQIIEDMNAGHPLGGSPVGSQVVYWKFDESYGTTANDTVGHQNGTVDSNLTWATASNCKVNGCLYWNAASEEVSIADASDSYYDFNGSEPFSGSTWVYSSTMPGAGEKDGIITAWDETGDEESYRLFLENDDADSTGNFQVEINDDSAGQVILATGAHDTVQQNTWYHVAWTFNGGTAGAAGDLKLYVNGSYVGQNSANASFLGLEDDTVDFAVGEYDATDVVAANTAFTGYIDEVKIYSAALTADEIKIDYNAGASINFGTGAATEKSTLTDGAGDPPVGYWPLDENTGTTTTYDKSGNGFNGTLGSITASSWIPGKYSSALDFDGSADYIRVTHNATLEPTSALTYMAWIKPDIVTGSRAIITKNDGNVTNYRQKHLALSNDEVVFHVYNGSNLYYTTTAANLVAGNWYHVTATVSDNNFVKIYVNGVLQFSDLAVGDLLLTEDEDLVIGADLNTGVPDTGIYTFFNGAIDEAKVFDYALTPAQVAYEYNRGMPVGWWKLDECQGATAYDASGNGNNGTITIGGTGDYTSLGTCGSGTSTEAWNAGTTGKINYALGFDGTDDEITIIDPSDGSLDMGTNDFSISAWVKTDDSSHQVIVSKGDYQSPCTSDGSQGYALQLISGVPNLRLNTGSAQSCISVTADNTLSTGIWHHLTTVADRDGNGYIYVDGNLLKTGSISGQSNTLDNDGNLKIGKYGSYEFNGLIDDVRIYNYALSATQIKNIMNQGGGVRFGPETGSP